jgi:hypothetical protein
MSKFKPCRHFPHLVYICTLQALAEELKATVHLTMRGDRRRSELH